MVQLSMIAILGGLAFQPYEPRPQITSPLTIVAESSQIENLKAPVRGPVEHVSWEQIRIDHGASGDQVEVPVHSWKRTYDIGGHVVEEIDRWTREARTNYTYRNGLLESSRTVTTVNGRPTGEDVWQTCEYDTNGRLVELKRGRGAKLENQMTDGYDSSGRLTRRENRQYGLIPLVSIQTFQYTEQPKTVKITVLRGGRGGTPTTMHLNQAGDVTELWSDEGFHVRWKYDDQRRVIDQLTDLYQRHSGCDECPLVGRIQTEYMGLQRHETFFDRSGREILKRITHLEDDGSIASIAYERRPPLASEEAVSLNRVVDSISSLGGERYVETIWDDHKNWIEKREYFRPRSGPPIVRFIYRRRIGYR